MTALDPTLDAPEAELLSAVSADELGSLRLFLGDEYVLDIFPDSSFAAHVESEFCVSCNRGPARRISSWAVRGSPGCRKPNARHRG